MKVNVKVKGKCVYYWDIVFKNYEGEEIVYTCVAPNYAKAVYSFVRFMGCARYDFVCCTTDGKAYGLH